MNISKNLQRLMQQHNISTERLAQDLAVSVETVNAWLAGTDEPETKHLMLLSKLFSITMDSLCSPVSEEKEERYVFRRNLQEGLSGIKAYSKYCLQPAIAGSIASVAMFIIVYLLPVDRLYYAIIGIVTLSMIISAVRVLSNTRKLKASYVKKDPTDRCVYTFTESTLHVEVWNEHGPLLKEMLKKDDISLLIEDSDRYTFAVGGTLYGISKALLPDDSVAHSFFAEQRQENRKHPHFLALLSEILQIISLGSVAISSYIYYDSGLSLAVLVPICMILLAIPLSCLIVLPLAKRKNTRITGQIIYSAIVLAMQLLHAFDLFREIFFVMFL